MLQTSLLLMKSLNKTETPIFAICSVFFVSKSNLFGVNYNSTNWAMTLETAYRRKASHHLLAGLAVIGINGVV